LQSSSSSPSSPSSSSSSSASQATFELSPIYRRSFLKANQGKSFRSTAPNRVELSVCQSLPASSQSTASTESAMPSSFRIRASTVRELISWLSAQPEIMVCTHVRGSPMFGAFMICCIIE
jgi:hypothetical protein